MKRFSEHMLLVFVFFVFAFSARHLVVPVLLVGFLPAHLLALALLILRPVRLVHQLVVVQPLGSFVVFQVAWV